MDRLPHQQNLPFLPVPVFIALSGLNNSELHLRRPIWWQCWLPGHGWPAPYPDHRGPGEPCLRAFYQQPLLAAGQFACLRRNRPTIPGLCGAALHLRRLGALAAAGHACHLHQPSGADSRNWMRSVPHSRAGRRWYRYFWEDWATGCSWRDCRAHCASVDAWSEGYQIV